MPDAAESELLGLLAEARGGNTDALGRLLQQYRSYLRLLARLQVSPELQQKLDPSDLVQDSLLEAQCSFPDFRGQTEAELTSWLRQILANNAANQWQRFQTGMRMLDMEQRFHERCQSSSQALERALASYESSPSERLHRRERAVLLADALERLPGDYREVLVLRHFEGLTLLEVANRMNRTEDSVKKLWARAVPRLRRLLKDVL
jgi:RNA polymerase sigma-70 factor (ECF subfamily)